ncbi:Zn-dependent exopeptidase [Conidiobolus coronatus NRRL 28638]|uniref:Zn-dependent exopeptidase n=1 Tax=Conidiobolus coronatus (strain ATCC 28846 / CBS 209.66 / NRRL 28638) TaxID=796925 RepID=A0A137P444_CONC2|nr:Zn-dependent exopeptidase [Conidiobolus coronatus NRRL 28638]|eukprot:KXN69776.1 Zn-dependent exopeptidase [Conidiobolus coronatus NRRL 28638]
MKALISIYFYFKYISCNFNNQEIWSCSVPNYDTQNQVHNFDILKKGYGYAIIRVMNDQEKWYLNRITSCSVIVSDLDQYYKNLQIDKSSESISNKPLTDVEYFNSYRTYDRMKIQFRYWAQKYSQYANFIESIGQSHEGRDIFAIEITNKNITVPKKNILYTGGQHAREWISPATVAYITSKLLQDANSDSQVKNHLQNFVYRIIPMINPDGYEYTNKYDRLWRKNRRNNGDGTYGVDLNRNWDYKWSIVGGSRDPSSIMYIGPYASSEPEVRSVANYIDTGWSWGWTTQPSSNHQILKKMGDSVVGAINSHGYKFISEQSSSLGTASGAADDYFAFKAKAVSMTLELCPGQEDPNGFELVSKSDHTLLFCSILRP